MTDTTDTIELIDRAEIKDGQAIVAYTRTEAALATLRGKYKDARYDLTTTAGDRAARAARLELTTTRTSLEKKRKELKAPAVEFGRKVDAEAARLTAEILALESPIDAQIKADEKRRDDERRAREEAEAARKKVHTDGITKIAGYVAQAAELPSERIGAGIAFLEAMDLAGFEEFTTEATETRDRSVAALRAMQAKAKAREDEEARLQAEREEQARVAAEQAEVARRLREEHADLERQRAALEAERAAARQEEEARAAAKLRQEQEAQQAAAEEAERLANRPALLERAREIVGDIEAAEVLGDAIAAQPGATVHPMPTRAPAAPSGPPTLRLGQINERLGFTVTADFLASLGYPLAGTDKAAKLWHESSWHGICAAIAQHVVAVANGQKAAA